jgi:hypothetical protein
MKLKVGKDELVAFDWVGEVIALSHSTAWRGKGTQLTSREPRPNPEASSSCLLGDERATRHRPQFDPVGHRAFADMTNRRDS